ncbi:hypothetical protein [Cupriavidus campinensis]|uniref:Uncharacterized protein n=1 Tax=Cupriavidus campinensis TaxID=151783 RepID=A0AAE9HXY9_9BURK|nr:hypothetical protein [Cupriavidus campinensis]URF03444.1 hypothetical protein M5D45_13025 [Cupriavidus campinensis]
MTLNFYRSKLFWIAAAALLIAGYNGLKDMMSVYKTDFGNGVIIYADDYVDTGRWVFDCEYSRLVSREPLPVPFDELERTEEFNIWDGYLKTADQQPAKEALAAITSVPHWYKNLRYLYSGLDDYSDLSAHIFDLVAEHAGRSWGGGSPSISQLLRQDSGLYLVYRTLRPRNLRGLRQGVSSRHQKLPCAAMNPQKVK